MILHSRYRISLNGIPSAYLPGLMSGTCRARPMRCTSLGCAGFFVVLFFFFGMCTPRAGTLAGLGAAVEAETACTAPTRVGRGTSSWIVASDQRGTKRLGSSRNVHEFECGAIVALDVGNLSPGLSRLNEMGRAPHSCRELRAPVGRMGTGHGARVTHDR